MSLLLYSVIAVLIFHDREEQLFYSLINGSISVTVESQAIIYA